MKRMKRGFTLIELMVVILILAILAALVVPRIVGRAADAKRAKAAADIATLNDAIRAFKLDTDQYPTQEEGLAALRQQPSGARNWRGPYIDKPISSDPWGTPYQYEYPGLDGPDSFRIYSFGADGQPGGEGDNADVTEGVDQ